MISHLKTNIFTTRTSQQKCLPSTQRHLGSVHCFMDCQLPVLSKRVGRRVKASQIKTP